MLLEACNKVEVGRKIVGKTVNSENSRLLNYRKTMSMIKQRVTFCKHIFKGVGSMVNMQSCIPTCEVYHSLEQIQVKDSTAARWRFVC